MKRIGKMVLGFSVCVSLSLSAEMATMTRVGTVAKVQTISPEVISRVTLACPGGWENTYDVLGERSKWGKYGGRAVFICKLKEPLIQCPSGTNFYRNNDEIGCRTVVK